MKIDASLPPLPPASFAPTLRQAESPLFEDLLSQHAGNDEAGIAGGQQAFSFNAYGILGSGPREMAENSPLPEKEKQLPANSAGSPHSAPGWTNIFATLTTPANLVEDTRATGISIPIHGTAAKPTGAFNKSPGSYSALQGVKSTAGKLAYDFSALTTIATAGPAIAMPASADPEPDAVPGIRKPSSKFALDTAHTAPAAEHLNVTVTDIDGTFHIVAAAPNLPEEARLKIRAIAEEMANDTGSALGNFLLNGTPVPLSHKFLNRSLSWRSHL